MIGDRYSQLEVGDYSQRLCVRSATRKKAGKIKTDSKVEIRKEVTKRNMRARNVIPNSDTARLRRGLSPTHGPRPVDLMAREACFSSRQFHRLTLRAIGETPGAHQRRLRLDGAVVLLIAPPFGGPATSLLRIAFSPQGKSATVMEVTDSTFGCLGDPTSTEEGWRASFEDGFKAWVERKR